MPEFVPGSDYVQDNGDGTYTTVIGGQPVFTGSKSGAEGAFNSAKGGGGVTTSPTGSISSEHREGLRRAGYPDWANPNLTEADFQRISSGAQRGGGGAGGIGTGTNPGNLNILPIEQMRLAIELANQEYLRKRLELLEIPEMQRRLELEGRNTDNDRHKIALDAATSFAQVSGWYLPGSFIENMVFQANPWAAEGVTPVYPQQPGQGEQAQPPYDMRGLTAQGTVGDQAGGTGGGMAATGMAAQGTGGMLQAQAVQRTDRYNTVTGIKTIDQMEAELKSAGWPGPGQGEDPIQAIINAYTGTAVGPNGQKGPVTPFTGTDTTQPGGTSGFPTLPPQYPGAPSWAYNQQNWMPTLDREKWWFDKQKYLTDLAANPRNLTQALLMLGMSPDQVSSFLTSTPSVNYLLNQGGWNTNLDPGAPSPYWDRTTGLPITPGSTNPVYPTQPGSGQPGMVYDPGGPPGATGPPSNYPVGGGGMVYDPGGPPNPQVSAQGDGLLSSLGALASPTIGGTTMPTDYNNSFDFDKYFQSRPGHEPGRVTPTMFDWRSWIQNNPWRNRWPQTGNPNWQAPPGYDLGGGNQPISTMGAQGGGGYDIGGPPGGGQPGGQPYVPGQIQDIMRSTPQGPLGTRNPNFPFITGRQMPVRQTLNWMDTNNPMIKLLQGLFSYSGQEPGNAFAEFQSFLPKGMTAGPTSYY